MKQLVRQLKNEIDELKKNYNELVASVQFQSDLLDENKLKIEALDNLHGKADIFDRQCKENNDNINDLIENLDQVDFHQHRNEVELSGVPEKNDECLSEILESIGQELEIKNIRNAVKSAERIGRDYRRINNRNPGARRNVVVKFHSVKVRDEFVSRGRSFMKHHTSPSTSRTVQNSTVFKHGNYRFRCHFNDYLSPKKKLLLSQCKEYVKCIGLGVIYSRCNQIFVRRTQDADPVIVRKLDDLKKL
jgi:hypothetical protein